MSLLLALVSSARELTATQGGYVVAGQAATLSRGRVLVAQAGAYALAGQAVTATRARVLVAQPGAYALSGRQASLARALTLSGNAGAYALAGRPAVISKAFELSAGAGAYGVAGGAAQFAIEALAAGKVGGDDVPRERVEVWTTRKARRVERKVRRELKALEALPEAAPAVASIELPQRAAAPDWSAYVRALQALETQLAHMRAELEERDEEEAILLLMS